MFIVKALKRIGISADVRFVSYATGAATFRAFGSDVIDLGVSQDPPLLDMIVLETQLLLREKPLLIIAHEEYAAATAADICGIPCVFLTDFFHDPSTLPMQALRSVAEVVYIGDKGIFTEPPQLSNRITYVGNAIRPFDYSCDDRDRARSELNLATTCLVVTCTPGSWPEAQVPLAGVLRDAWDGVDAPQKHLFWVAGSDHREIQARFAGQRGVVVIHEELNMGRLIAASDVIITKGTRTAVYEAASLGVPSISVSSGNNWIDDVATSRVATNIRVETRALTAEVLRSLIRSLSAGGRREPYLSDGIRLAALRIAEHINNRANVRRAAGS
jgi:UDP-N-acetylglucosamine:LPS N-acetylglucosamine transferase